MKVSELTGAQLDYWVARAKGTEILSFEDDIVLIREGCWSIAYEPSTEWAQGGPIIEREGISLLQIGFEGNPVRWSANFETWHEDRDDLWTGPTALVAAMRAYVAGKLGDEVGDEAA